MEKATGSLPSQTDYEQFEGHRWVRSVLARYERKAVLAEGAVAVLVDSLVALNREYGDRHGRTLFTSIDGRVKERVSFTKKLWKKAKPLSRSAGMSEETLNRVYEDVLDIAGVRFSCPYYDEVEDTINQHVRPYLGENGYRIEFPSQDKYGDRNYLDAGDDWGYRSFHFFVEAPVQVDIFGAVEHCLVEVQARTELQHVWAVKSHDLLYKPQDGWVPADDDIREDMRQVSNGLRAADQFLVSIRNRVRAVPHDQAGGQK